MTLIKLLLFISNTRINGIEKCSFGVKIRVVQSKNVFCTRFLQKRTRSDYRRYRIRWKIVNQQVVHQLPRNQENHIADP